MSGELTRAHLEAVLGGAVLPNRLPEKFAAVQHLGEAAVPGALLCCFDEFHYYNRWQHWRAGLAAFGWAERMGALLVPRPVAAMAAVPQIIVREPRTAYGQLAARAYGMPGAQLELVGVTGTNGKTTTVRLCEHLFSDVAPWGSLGTLGLSIGGQALAEGEYTTPMAGSLQHTLAEALARGARGMALEVSSHALALERTAGLEFAVVVVTNIERDHLEFHGQLGAYHTAKLRLMRHVKRGGAAVLNASLPDYGRFAATARAAGARVLRYGWAEDCDLQASIVEMNAGGMRLDVHWAGKRHTLNTQLVGRFHAENLLAALGALLAMGGQIERACERVRTFAQVPGRMERWALHNGAVALIDYAHNPDGLRALLQNARALLQSGRLLCVFGCGGDRDRGKRPVMGQLAAQWADDCWVTSDNPRTEDPQAIIADILKGMAGGHSNVQVEVDRAAAIRAACAASRPGDLLVIAGKGHEAYQIIGTRKYPYADQSVVAEFGRRA